MGAPPSLTDFHVLDLTDWVPPHTISGGTHTHAHALTHTPLWH